MPAAPIAPRDGLDVLTFPVLGDTAVDAVVTTRHGGVSTGPYRSLNLGLHVDDDPRSVMTNRRRAAAAMGLDLADLVFARQVHGARVAVVDRSDRGRGTTSEAGAIDGVDAMVTTDPGVGLAVLAADCVPAVLFDPIGRVLAVAHAGWRGVAAGALPAAVAAMAALGTDAADVVAGLGPVVGADRYQVGPEVVAAVDAAVGPGLATPDDDGRWRLDLVRAAARALVAVGVGRVEASGWATGGDGPFFSDRDERPCGRFALIAALR